MKLYCLHRQEDLRDKLMHYAHKNHISLSRSLNLDIIKDMIKRDSKDNDKIHYLFVSNLQEYDILEEYEQHKNSLKKNETQSIALWGYTKENADLEKEIDAMLV